MQEKYISFQKYIFTQKMFVLQTKYKFSYLCIYSAKKHFFDHKLNNMVNSIIWSVKFRNQPICGIP